MKFYGKDMNSNNCNFLFLFTLVSYKDIKTNKISVLIYKILENLNNFIKMNPYTSKIPTNSHYFCLLMAQFYFF